MTTKTAKKPAAKAKKQTNAQVVIALLATTKTGVTLKQIAARITKISGKETTERQALTVVNKVGKTTSGMELHVIESVRSVKYKLLATTTPAATETPASPAKPITFGRPKNSEAVTNQLESPSEEGKPVAGSRSAKSFVDSLAAGQTS